MPEFYSLSLSLSLSLSICLFLSLFLSPSFSLSLSLSLYIYAKYEINLYDLINLLSYPAGLSIFRLQCLLFLIKDDCSLLYIYIYIYNTVMITDISYIYWYICVCLHWHKHIYVYVYMHYPPNVWDHVDFFTDTHIVSGSMIEKTYRKMNRSANDFKFDI